MEKSLSRFNVFIVEGGELQDALEVCKTLDIDSDNIFIYEQLKIDDIRQIKDKSSLVADQSEAFVFGEIGFDAQNALLKLLEEYDEFRYFILYKSDMLLDTISSRAQHIKAHKIRKTDKELSNMIQKEEFEAMLTKALLMQDMPKEDVVDILEGLAREFSIGSSFDKARIINERLLKFKNFRLNQKLFLFTLFFKLSGGV